MNTINFEQLVGIAIEEIRDAYENHYGWDWEQDFIKDVNYSEICEWCGFPDLQTSESIYERAINLAIIILSHNYTTNKNICESLTNLAKGYAWL